MHRFFEHIRIKLQNDVSINTLSKIIMMLLIILLLIYTKTFWHGMFYTIWKIVKPFFVGFIIAYIIHPLIKKGEEKNISRKWSIPLIYIVACVFLGWLTYTIIPLIYSRLNEFITSMISGVNSFYGAYADVATHQVPNWLTQFMKSAIDTLNDVKLLTSDMGAKIPGVLQDTARNFTLAIFILIISIYMCFGWEKVETNIKRFTRMIGDQDGKYLAAIDSEIGTYIRSLISLMIIKFAEYALLYYCVGHKDWLIIAVLTSIGLIVPYVGATIANCIGIITALTLPIKNIIVLLVMIVVLSNVDAYAISPLVHAHNVKMSPLWSLFAIFAGGIIAGAPGVIFAIPLYLAIRVSMNMKENEEELKTVDGKEV